MLPVDWVRWTEAYEKALAEVEKRAKEELGATKLEMRHDRYHVGRREEGDGLAGLDGRRERPRRRSR